MKNNKFLFVKDIYNFIPVRDYKELNVIEASFRGKHPDISKQPMKKPYYALHLFLKGHGRLETERGNFTLNPGDIFIRFPSEEIRYYDFEDSPWEYIFITFQGTRVVEYMERLEFSPENRIFRTNRVLTDLFCNMITNCREHAPSSDIIAVASLYGIFAQLAMARCASSYEKYDSKQSYVMKALEYIDSAYSVSDLSAEEIAKYLNLNIDYFLRIFKQKTGTPFSKFLISKRMSIAISMLDKGETSISKLAYAVGYKSPAYFTSAFKKAFNMVPSEYVKSQTGK